MLTRLITLNRALTSQIGFNFCVNTPAFWALDPQKHIYMQHNFHNMYDDLHPLGDYSYITRLPVRVDDQVFTPTIVNIVTKHLAAKYPNIQLNWDSYNEGNAWVRTWENLGVSDFDSEVEPILHKLASEIFVKQSKLTWVKEQRERLEISVKAFQYLKFSKYPVYGFVDSYNQLIWQLARRSNLWTAPEIVGVRTAMETHLDQQFSPRPGISSLQRQRPENETFINRLMNAIH